jgi:hypothetical protein
MADDYEYVSVICPEGHGNAQLTLYIREHRSSMGNRTEIDKRAVYQSECDLQSSLLRNGRNCNWSCKKTEEYKSAMEAINLINE